MSKFVVKMVNLVTGEEIYEDEEFSTEEEAERYACECGGNFAEGAEVLSQAGRDYTDPEDVDFEVEELDD